MIDYEATLQEVNWSPSEWLFSLRYRPSRFCLVKRVKKLRTEPRFFPSWIMDFWH